MRPGYWWACGAVALFAASSPALLWKGGTMDREATTFIWQYTTDERPVLRKIFDPHKNDWGTYQARELSYFFDYLDAVVYRFLFRQFGTPVFVPMSACLASLLLTLIFFVGVSRTAEHVDPLTAALLFVCVASSFVCVSTLGVFYRSAKALLATALLGLLFQARDADQRQKTGYSPARIMTKDAAAACALGIAAGLLDRQGFAYVIAGCLLVGLHTFWVGRLKDVCAGLVAAAGVLVAYNYALAPVAIRLLNGYWPNFSYQHIPVEDLSSLVVKTGQAGKMLVENAALLAGGSFASGALFLAGVIVALARSARGATFAAGTHARAITYCALGFAAQVLMFALMIARHPNVYADLDHRYWYYPFPFAITVLFAAVAALNATMRRDSAPAARVVRGVLILMIVGNLASIPVHRQVMAHGNWFGAIFPQSAALKRSIDTGRPDPIFDPAYKRFLDIHERWRRGDARPKTRS